MAVGTTYQQTLKRWEILESAYRKIRALPIGRQMSHEQLVFGTRALNLLLRKESQVNARRDLLYALSTAHVIMIADQHIYDSTDLPTDIERIDHAYYRDKDGADTALSVLNKRDYDLIEDKDEKGTPEAIFLERNITLASQKLYIYPALDSITTASVATGSDALDYTCIMKHTSATINKPITGDEHTMFWKQTGSGGSAWAADTAYTATEVIGLVYRRPLWLFDVPASNPDMPLGWEHYLIYKLATHLAPEHGLSPGEVRELKTMALEEEADLFPSTRSETEELHNKGVYY